MNFGRTDWGIDEPAARSVLNTYSSLGGNFIDTADVYSSTAAESIVGRWLQGVARESVVVATKCGMSVSPSAFDSGLSRSHILRSCENSLRRLQTDYIDLFQVHLFDWAVPLEETLSTLSSLVDSGKIRYSGLCNFPGWAVSKANGLSSQKNLAPFISGQYLYNLLKRDIELEVVPACEDGGVGILCWSPLSGGMLSGRYFNHSEPPSDSRLGRRTDLTNEKNVYAKWQEKAERVIQTLGEIAEERDVSRAEISLAWLLNRPGVTGVVIGASKPDQVMQNVAASDLHLSWDEMRRLNESSFCPTLYPQSMYAKNPGRLPL